MLDAAGVHDDRPGDDGDAAAAALDVAHHLGDARDAAFDAPLRRHVVAHEGEAEPVAFAELGRHADAVVAADDRLAGLARRAACGTRRVCPSTTITASMRWLLDFHPLAAEPDVGAVVGRRVEVVGDAAVLFRRLDEHVALADRMAAERRELLQQVVERRAVGAR